MERKQKIKKPEFREDDSINLLELLAKLWHGRKTILLTTLIFGIIGVVVGELTPNSYQASSVFIAQTSNDKPSASLGGLASLAGINLSSMGGNSGISIELYPKISYSLPFKRAMLEAQIVYEKQSMTYADYLKHQPTPLVNYIKKYTIGLPGHLIGLLKQKPSNEEAALETGYGLRISSEESALIGRLGSIIELVINQKEGFITLSINDPAPEVAAQMATWAEQELQERVIAYQIKNTKELFDFTQAQYLEKQQEVFALQDQIARFTVENQDISSPYVQNELRRLESEYNMVYTIYTQLASQKEQVALQIKKDLPIFMIIDPVRIPNAKAGPNRKLILIIGVFLGGIISSGYLLVKEPLEGLIQAIKKN